MKEQLTSTVQGQLGNLHDVDAKELGEVVDMIKDLAEAIYYCSITEAMEESKKEEKPQMNNTYYTMPMDYRDNGRMYYGGQDRNNSRYYMPDMYREREWMPEYMTQDPREGRAKQSRRMYMEAKEMHQPKTTQMKELEKYLQELSSDIVEMIQDASPEEKSFMEKKIQALATKINQGYTLGVCDDTLKTIYINAELNEKYIEKVLCHELTHAAMFSYNINLTIEQEELLADLIATYGQEIVYITNLIFQRIKEKKGEL